VAAGEQVDCRSARVCSASSPRTRRECIRYAGLGATCRILRLRTRAAVPATVADDGVVLRIRPRTPLRAVSARYARRPGDRARARVVKHIVTSPGDPWKPLGCAGSRVEIVCRFPVASIVGKWSYPRSIPPRADSSARSSRSALPECPCARLIREASDVRARVRGRGVHFVARGDPAVSKVSLRLRRERGLGVANGFSAAERATGMRRVRRQPPVARPPTCSMHSPEARTRRVRPFRIASTAEDVRWADVVARPVTSLPVSPASGTSTAAARPQGASAGRGAWRIRDTSRRAWIALLANSTRSRERGIEAGAL